MPETQNEVGGKSLLLKLGIAITNFLITPASAIIEKTAHGLSVGDVISFPAVSGSPIIDDSLFYFVKSVPDADSFTISETLGGAELVFDGLSEVTRVEPTAIDNTLYTTGGYFIIEDEDGTVACWFGPSEPVHGADRAIDLAFTNSETKSSALTKMITAIDGDSKFTAVSTGTGGTPPNCLITCVEPGARADVDAATSTFTVAVVTDGEDMETPSSVDGIGYLRIGGLRSKNFSFKANGIVITSHDSDEFETILDEAGVRSMSISGAGVFSDETTKNLMEENCSENAMTRLMFIDVKNYRIYEALYKIKSFDCSGDYNAEGKFSLAADSSGSLTLVTL